MKYVYKITHLMLITFDFIASFFALPWEYSEKHMKRMKEKIDGKK